MSKYERSKEIDKAVKNAYKNLIADNWKNIRKHLEKMDIPEPDEESPCLIVTISAEEGSIEMSIAGIDYKNKYGGSPDDLVTIFIDVASDTTKGELKSKDVSTESEYWDNDGFISELLGEEEDDDEEYDDDDDEEEDDDDDEDGYKEYF